MNSTVTLNSGYKMPILGLGTYLAKDIDVESAVITAINNGYRMIDTASKYISSTTILRNHKPIGRAIKKCIEQGIVKRDDLFIATKLWMTDWEPEQMEKAMKQNLIDLQLDYVDLYIIHWPMFLHLPEEEEEKRDPNYFFSVNCMVPDSPEYRIGYDVDRMKQTWTKLEEFVQRGIVHSIGLSNTSTKKLNDILSFCSIKPSVNQIELNPRLQQWKTKEFCDKNNIYLTAYYPLGGAKPVPGTVVLMEDPVITAIAAAHNKTTAQVLIRWAIQRGTLCIPKSIKPERIVSNANVFDFEMTEEEMEKIREMDKGKRTSCGNMFVASPVIWKAIWDGEYID